MGLRNPFRMDFDPETGAVTWGDYGPDAGTANVDRGPMGYVEWQSTTVPVNGGWPLCHGPNAEGMEALKAPALNHQADWYMLHQLHKFKSGMRGAHPEDIYGSQMRAMSLTLENEKAMLDVITYVRTLSR